MNVSHYIGFDVHKKHINFCIKTGEGAVVEQGRLAAQRSTLRAWAAGQTQAWHGAMEATLFSGWIYDTLKPYATCLEMAHPLMLKAIVASKKRYEQHREAWELPREAVGVKEDPPQAEDSVPQNRMEEPMMASFKFVRRHWER